MKNRKFYNKIFYPFQKNFNLLEIDELNEKKLYENCIEIIEEKLDISNTVYLQIDEKIKKIKNILQELEQEKINIKFNEFINKNIGLDRNIEELIDFDNFLKSKFEIIIFL